MRSFPKVLHRWMNYLIPDYALVPMLLGVSFNFIGYFGIQQFRSQMTFYDFSIGLDDRIPFIPAFIFIYVGAYIQWIVGFICCGREDRDFVYRFMSAEFIAKAISLICFLVIPSTILRPSVYGTDPASHLVRFIYASDAPMNLFPSIHCLESWFCLRCAFAQKKTGPIYTFLMAIASGLVFASVVLVKQHVFVDIIGGILVFELGMLLTRRKDLRGMYMHVTRFLLKRIGIGELVNE